MNPKILKLSLAFLLFTLIGASCQDDDYDSGNIIGKWRMVWTEGGVIGGRHNVEENNIIWEFDNDSMLIMHYDTEVNEFRFHTNNDTLNFIISSTENIYIYDIEGNSLNLYQFNDRMFFKRIK